SVRRRRAGWPTATARPVASSSSLSDGFRGGLTPPDARRKIRQSPADGKASRGPGSRLRDEVPGGVEQGGHLDPLEPPGEARVGPGPGPAAEGDEGERVPDAVPDEPRGPPLVEQGSGPARQRVEDAVSADATEPVGGVARVGLPSVGDPVPV